MLFFIIYIKWSTNSIGSDFALAFFQYPLRSTNGASSYLVGSDFGLAFFSIMALKYKLIFGRIRVWFHSFFFCTRVFIKPGQYILIFNQNLTYWFYNGHFHVLNIICWIILYSTAQPKCIFSTTVSGSSHKVRIHQFFVRWIVANCAVNQTENWQILPMCSSCVAVAVVAHVTFAGNMNHKKKKRPR